MDQSPQNILLLLVSFNSFLIIGPNTTKFYQIIDAELRFVFIISVSYTVDSALLHENFLFNFCFDFPVKTVKPQKYFAVFHDKSKSGEKGRITSLTLLCGAHNSDCSASAGCPIRRTFFF